MPISARALPFLSLFAAALTAAKLFASPAAPGEECRAVQEGEQVELRSPFFALRLDASEGLRALWWENRLAGERISLGGGPELEIDVDTAERRIGIAGWRCARSQSGDAPPDEERGYREGFARPEFDDAGWQPAASPASDGPAGATGYTWARARAAIPEEAEGRELSLTIGGFGLFDYRFLRAFLNGQLIGSRAAPQRWREPLSIDLGPSSDGRRHVRFGQENVLALQLSGFAARLPRLEELDPRGTREQAMRFLWPAQFEQCWTVGKPSLTLRLRTSAPRLESGDEAAQAIFELRAEEPSLSAIVAYRWNAREPVLRKTVVIANTGDRELRLLNVRLGSYRTEARVSDGEQGFPVYLDDAFFLSLAHPSGWAIGQSGEVKLRQFPGRRLAPGEKFSCMEAVLGVAAAGSARGRFLEHVRSRMRRVARGHDKPYAIFDNFASWSMAGDPGLFTKNSERAMLHSLERLAESQKATGRLFDLCNLHFWFDIHSDMTRFDPARFPGGFAPVKRKLDELGIAPGLWISSTFGDWSTVHPKYAGCCRAQEPLRSAYTAAFRHHIRENGVREVKFDNNAAMCYSAAHDHLPGVYSTEAIHDAVLETLRGLDAENPAVFIILYWGHRSPWWLLDGDTLFEPGLFVEAAHPGPFPTLYARDSVTQGLDQAHWYCDEVPRLGKDSLGVWLSDWGWNSSIGKERWQEGFVMDLCRGSLLAQPWSDEAWLSPPEWRQMADFIALLRARPDCFGNPRFILGNPWKDEPYGYCCADGKRAFIALNNCSWKDSALRLELNSAWGLPDGRSWNLYRWYPEPARLRGQAEAFGEEASIALRPFEIALLEAVPAGEAPTLNRAFESRPIPAAFADPTRAVDVSLSRASPEGDPAAAGLWTVLEPAAFSSAGGAALKKLEDNSILASGKTPSPDTYKIVAHTALTGITAIRLEVLPDPSLPSGGPGRAFNGNFALNEFRVSVAPLGKESAAAPIFLRRPRASFSQASYGGWPIEAALDGDPGTAWSIDPQEGSPHAAVFEAQEPVGFPGGTALTFQLGQGYLRQPPDHTIGRLRLAITTARPPVPLPQGFGANPLVARGRAPASARGGTLIFALEMRRGPAAAVFGDVGSRFTCEGRLGGKAIPCQPVLGQATYPASWQAWRLPVEPAAEPQPFELAVRTTLPKDLEWTATGYFIPK
ncbi:MAG: hypothetical protein HY717_11880 [Planctomycetes bacterium]|nr:hypothetical protein [Planctomycetota bacterium]